MDALRQGCPGATAAGENAITGTAQDVCVWQRRVYSNKREPSGVLQVSNADCKKTLSDNWHGRDTEGRLGPVFGCFSFRCLLLA